MNILNDNNSASVDTIDNPVNDQVLSESDNNKSDLIFTGSPPHNFGSYALWSAVAYTIITVGLLFGGQSIVIMVRDVLAMTSYEGIFSFDIAKPVFAATSFLGLVSFVFTVVSFFTYKKSGYSIWQACVALSLIVLTAGICINML